ncbi:MAG: helix-turn-helix domain-containing protein [Chloroflexia bacterium]
MSTLRSLREKKGLTVSQLAGKASIPSRIIADYEEGRVTITLAHAKVLAKALWVGIEDLMPPAGSIPPTASQAAVPSAPPVQRQAPAPPAPRLAQPEVQRPTPSYASGPAQAPTPSQGYNRQERPDYVDSAPRTEAPRPPRPGGTEGRDGAHRRPSGDSAAARPARPAPPPPSAISEGQVEELERLAAKLEIAIEQLEERIGKKVSELTRPEAKDWIKRIRGMAEEIAPSKKSAYGQWPGGHVDQEASYLATQKESGAFFRFKLFNGEEIIGIITDYTPYTITVSTDGSGDDTVIRKLAIAYYRRGEANTAAEAPAQAVAAAPKRTRTTKAQAAAAAAAAAHNHEEDAHQPLESGIGSDRPTEPEAPEIDSMDEDRGI